MSNKHIDIDDDQIRIISSDNLPEKRANKRNILYIIMIAVVLTIAGALIFVRPSKPRESVAPASRNVEATSGSPYATSADTTGGDIRLNILTPHNATPALARGEQVLDDNSVILAIQAADIRADNLEIVCAYVEKGELVSKGEAKAGFCSIVNGELTVGVADATPMFEQALNNDGYFFRQYPLVVAGQIVENKPQGKAVRKALAEIDGEISIISSRERISYRDFSEALVKIGVDNAISLVGANSSGVYVDADGKRHVFGDIPPEEWKENINYILWKTK